MKIGDMVKMKPSGEIGLVLQKVRRCVPDGNPNGDFNIECRYKIAVGDEVFVVPQRNFFLFAEVVTSCKS